MTRFLFFLLSPFLLWMVKADAVFAASDAVLAADPPCVYNRSFNACCNNGLAQRIDEYVLSETTEVCWRDTNDCNLSEPSCPSPNPGQCLWGEDVYSERDVRYQCGFVAGGCSLGSCLGVSYVCSASGDWVSDNPSPQCTSECTDCTGGPPPTPSPGPSVVDGTPQCTIRGRLSAPGVIYQDETATFLAGVEVQGGGAADIEIDRNINDSFPGDDFVQMTRISCVASATCTTNVTWVPTASDLGKAYNVFCRGYNTAPDPDLECRPFEPRLAGPDCGPEDYLRLRVEPPPPWFQTKGGDIYLEGDLISRLPATVAPPRFSLEDGGFPGVVSAKGNIDFGPNVSPTQDWQAKNSQDYGAGDFYYDHFAEKVQESTLPPISNSSDFANLPTGFYIAGSELNLPPLEVRGGKQIVILAKKNLNIEGKIQVDDDSFFAVIVKEKITIDPSVYEADWPKAAISGVFIAEEKIQTGASDKPLVVRGVWAAKGGFNLQRERTVGLSIPSERFDYDINLVMKAPDQLLSAPFIWQETNQ